MSKRQIEANKSPDGTHFMAGESGQSPNLAPAVVEGQTTAVDAFYDNLNETDANWAMHLAEAIRQKNRNSIQNLLDTGEMLIGAKKRLGHGNYLKWVRLEFPGEERVAQMKMRVYVVFNSEIISDLEKFDPTALYKLSAKTAPKKARIEALALAKAGKWVSCSIAIALVRKHGKPGGKRGKEKPIRSIRLNKPLLIGLEEVRENPDETLESIILRAIAALRREKQADKTKQTDSKDPTPNVASETSGQDSSKGPSQKQGITPKRRAAKRATKADLSLIKKVGKITKGMGIVSQVQTSGGDSVTISPDAPRITGTDINIFTGEEELNTKRKRTRKKPK